MYHNHSEQLAMNFDNLDQIAPNSGGVNEHRLGNEDYEDDDIDRMAEILGSYNEAYRALGLDSSHASDTAEIIPDPVPVVESRIAVNLAERALNLMAAIKASGRENKAEARLSRVSSGIDKSISLDSAIRIRDAVSRQAALEFRKAYGLQPAVESAVVFGDSAQKWLQDATNQRQDMKDQLSGSENRTKREKYTKKILPRYLE
ncbi:MAG: hypothetical protein ACM3KH_00430 [Thiobacillus sp.]